MFEIEPEILSDKSVVFNIVFKDYDGAIILADRSCSSEKEANEKLKLLESFEFEINY